MMSKLFFTSFVCLCLLSLTCARRSVPSTSTPAGKVAPFSAKNVPYPWGIPQESLEDDEHPVSVTPKDTTKAKEVSTKKKTKTTSFFKHHTKDEMKEENDDHMSKSKGLSMANYHGFI